MTRERMGVSRFAPILAFALAAGCAGTDVTSLQASKPLEPPAVGAPALVATPGSPPSIASAPSAKGDAGALPPVPPATAAAKAPAVGKEAAKVEQSARATHPAETHVVTGGAPKATAKSDAAISAAKPVVAEPPKKEVAPIAARKAEPTLDVADLKTKLRETPAIGTFTKLALKNQMDDLVERFRALYQGGQRTGVATLRQPFDALVGKVLTQLRPGDPSLARTIESSREAIWGILSDPEKFKSVS